jgi:hypothetical protein
MLCSLTCFNTVFSLICLNTVVYIEFYYMLVVTCIYSDIHVFIRR